MRTVVIVPVFLLLGFHQACGEPATTSALRPVVEVEEDVYRYEPANNGAGPLWCHGSTCLVRIGDDVFASGLETLDGVKPLNNCRWTLYKRGHDGWEYKKQITGRDWDYDFRRLFYTWTERATDARLRDKFFPDVKQTHALNYATVRRGKVLGRRTLLLGGEGASDEVPRFGRFQVTPEGRLFVFYYTSGKDAAGKSVSENRLMELLPDGTESRPVTVPLKHPLSSYFTATIRGGSPPSRTLEVLGARAGVANTISYARIKLW